MEKKGSFVRRIPSIIGILLCIVLIPILVMNLTIIVKSYIYPDDVPDFFGIKPFIVLTGSMEGTVNAGDLAITKDIEPETLQVGDIISYKIDQSIITHRIIEEIEVDGLPAFRTKGDANNIEDTAYVLYEQVEGVYMFRIAGIGNLAMFMQTPVGMIVFIAVPLCAFILYDIIRRNIQSKKERQKDNAMQKELEQLRHQVNDQQQ